MNRKRALDADAAPFGRTTTTAARGTDKEAPCSSAGPHDAAAQQQQHQHRPHQQTGQAPLQRRALQQRQHRPPHEEHRQPVPRRRAAFGVTGALVSVLAVSLLAPGTDAFEPLSVASASGLPRLRVAPRPAAVSMIGNVFNGQRRSNDPDGISVNIERPSSNSRRISASVLVDRPMEDIWKILTDYDNLSVYVPNLVQSKLVHSPSGGIRLFQEGAQKIVGLDFSASLTMDMEEVLEREGSAMGRRAINFKLVESRFFSEFDGKWMLQVHSRRPKPDSPGEFAYTTKLFYEVLIRPNGPVPVLPLEWRIKEDVPTNLMAVKTAAQNRMFEMVNPTAHQPAPPTQPAGGDQEPVSSITWEQEETLDLYINKDA